MSGEQARFELERIINEVEDELSGIVANPSAALVKTDGRIYAPNDKYEIPSSTALVRIFRQLGHRTSFGLNGAITIVHLDGKVEIDLKGKDGRSVADLSS